jgi:hypothetical protein
MIAVNKGWRVEGGKMKERIGYRSNNHDGSFDSPSENSDVMQEENIHDVVYTRLQDPSGNLNQLYSIQRSLTTA